MNNRTSFASFPHQIALYAPIIVLTFDARDPHGLGGRKRSAYVLSSMAIPSAARRTRHALDLAGQQHRLPGRCGREALTHSTKRALRATRRRYRKHRRDVVIDSMLLRSTLSADPNLPRRAWRRQADRRSIDIPSPCVRRRSTTPRRRRNPSVASSAPSGR
jgi:hypothetical protein